MVILCYRECHSCSFFFWKQDVDAHSLNGLQNLRNKLHSEKFVTAFDDVATLRLSMQLLIAVINNVSLIASSYLFALQGHVGRGGKEPPGRE